ncbi:hypothetical protein LTR04_004087 [Oleoguttula sp. CCFEE 6159]|nr:hypothetical protein LTR04_004087 [Oleoguttula sp. CCFEE 6159]
MPMGASDSKSLRTSGQVDGKPADFEYTRNEEEQLLSYRFANSDCVETLQREDIVALLPVHAQFPDDYSILYVVPPGDASARKIPIFQSMIATRLPEHFIHDFSPSGSSCWQLRSDRDGNRGRPNLHVVISTLSGAGLALDLFYNVVKHVLSYTGLQESRDYVVHCTQSERTITELTTSVFLPRANEANAQAIILFSGDGGVVDIVNTLLGGHRSKQYVRPSIALLPLGTGNALAHSLDVTTDNTLGLATMIKGAHQPLPLFKATFSPGARILVHEGSRQERLQVDAGGMSVMYGAVVCSWGFHAGLVADSDTAEYRKFGAERFQMAAKEALFPADGSEPHRYKAMVSLLRRNSERASKEEWQTLDREEHMYVLATLVSRLEKGFTISPASKPLDGKLRLVHFGPMPSDEVMRIMGQAYQGGHHVDEEAVGYEDIDGVRIDFGGREENARWRRICVDGKIILVEPDGWVEVRKGGNGAVDVVCMP